MESKKWVCRWQFYLQEIWEQVQDSINMELEVSEIVMI